ncbi:PBECR3 domain-containing polyvalent protein [Helicobacter pylori]|uniref:PBECR3 domain-containing polyvalent protein n=1 Tax=Helicobacter pylori TaxID=210 RepID=UPI00359C2A29
MIVNKSDLKPNFKNTGTQTRTAVDSKKVEEIAKRFDPKLIIGRGGFDDLPVILPDGQIIAGNHRTQGMLNFNAESRKKYEQAIRENFNIELKPDELLVRMPEQELNDKEIFKLASKSNENRANSFSDMLLSAMSSYNDKLKHLAPKFESDSVENLANQVARALEKDAKIPSHTQVENANLALLSHYARNAPNNSFLEVFDNAYKNLDREQFKAFKEMFAYNSANFHNLNNDTMLKKFTISPYLTDALDTSAKMLESGNRADNFSKLVNDINYLVNSTDENGMNAFIKENKDAYHSVISELLGSSFARFLRLENPSTQFYEFLTKAKDRMIENAADIFSGTSKPIHQINIFDFIKYGIESGKSSKESRELLDLLPKLEKKFNAYERLKQEPLNALKLETKKGIKRDYSDTNLSNDEIKKLIDESPRTGSSMPILGMQNLHAEAVEYIQKNHKRIAVEKIEPSFAKDLKLKYPDDARAVIDYQAINHILKEHKNLSYEDIANYRKLSKQANETLKLKDNQNRPVVASFNQIDGFFVVVEQVSNAKNELMLKTMYKARGNYKDSLIYKKTLAKSQNSN